MQLALRLFDALVVPILTYAGVVWGPLYAHKITYDNFFTLCNDSPIEKINVKLCKYLLGVHKKSTNNAVRGELGRYPILINVLEHSSRYYHRIFSVNKRDSLVNISCMDSEVCSITKSWVSIMDRLHDMFSRNSIKTDMFQLYKQKWEDLMHTFSSDPDGKLRSYGKFKKSFQIENYVLQFPLNIRRNLTKLRISAHNLAIETGRYTKPIKTPVEKRICFHCKKLEDELHFFCECELFTEERLIFSKTLSTFSSLTISSSRDIFNSFMSCLNGDVEMGRAVCSYINTCFTVRTKALSEKNEKDILIRPKLTVTQFGRHSTRPERLDL